MSSSMMLNLDLKDRKDNEADSKSHKLIKRIRK